MSEPLIHPSAFIDEPSSIGEGTRIWHCVHVMSGARIGQNCVLGQNVFIAKGAVIGNGVRIQNNVAVYAGVILEDAVFVGPSAVFTNVRNPRGEIDRHVEFLPTHVERGVTIGANATIVCGHRLGRYAFIAAGAVVATDVPPYALMMGVPAIQKGWMSRHGEKLPEPDADGIMHCPISGWRYAFKNSGLLCLDYDDTLPLPVAS